MKPPGFRLRDAVLLFALDRLFPLLRSLTARSLSVLRPTHSTEKTPQMPYRSPLPAVAPERTHPGTAVSAPRGLASNPRRPDRETAIQVNQSIGGAAQFYARSLEDLLNVHLAELGIPEAMRHLFVQDFPAIIMDAHGESLHSRSEKEPGSEIRSPRFKRSPMKPRKLLPPIPTGEERSFSTAPNFPYLFRKWMW